MLSMIGMRHIFKNTPNFFLCLFVLVYFLCDSTKAFVNLNTALKRLLITCYFNGKRWGGKCSDKSLEMQKT